MGASRMRWLKKSNSANDEITYVVANGYELRHRLSQLGFGFDKQLKQWTCVVRRDQVELIGRIETLWAHGEPGTPPPEVDPQSVRQRTDLAPELRIIDPLLKEKSWLYPAELSILQSMRRSVLNRPLSDRQLRTMEEIRGRVGRRKEPKFVPGGSPGQGRRKH